MIGTHPGNGRVYKVFRAANGACTITGLTAGPGGLTTFLLVFGTSGNDVIRVAAGTTPLCGLNWLEVDVNSHFIDVYAQGGHDWVLGKFRDVFGGTGNDVLSGASGFTENILGEGGADYLYGSENSQLNGGTGNDVLCAQSDVTVDLFRGGDQFDQGCGPYRREWNNDMEEIDENCPEVCQIL